MLIWELLGAIVGAGFASGREIASFFAQHHPWGYAGSILAAVSIVWLADTKLPASWRNHWPEWACKVLIVLMLLATGGAMLSGAGEISSMLLPLKHAYWIGSVFTLMVAWLMAHRTVSGLAWISKALLVVFTALMIISMVLPRTHITEVGQSDPLQALKHSICYSGFNAALLLPFLQRKSSTERKKSLFVMSFVLSVLLLGGNVVFQLHPQILYEPLPFVSLTRQLGKPGFYLCGICLYTAVLSTLTACLRSLGKSLYAVVGIILISLLGFPQVVEKAYMYLGAACCVMFLAAKFRNCAGKAFISRTDML